MTHPPSPAYLLAGLGMIALALAAVLAWQKGKPPLWWASERGLLAWVAASVLTALLTAPTSAPVRQALTRLAGPAAGGPLSWVYTGLLAGLIQCGVAYFLARGSRLRQAGWNEAVAFGLGFAAAGVFVTGVFVFAGVLLTLLSWKAIAPAEQARLASAYAVGAASILLPILANTLDGLGRVLTNVLVVYAVRAGRPSWLWPAVLYQSAIQAVGIWGVSAPAASLAQRPAALEAVLALLGLLAVPALTAMKRRFAAAGNA